MRGPAGIYVPVDLDIGNLRYSKLYFQSQKTFSQKCKEETSETRDIGLRHVDIHLIIGAWGRGEMITAIP